MQFFNTTLHLSAALQMLRYTGIEVGRGEWWWCQSNGLIKKKQQTNNNSPARTKLHETEQTMQPQNNTSSIFFMLLLYVLQSSRITQYTFFALFSGVIAYFLYSNNFNGRSSVLTQSDSWCCFYWWRLTYKLDCAPSSEFSLIYGILPLFTHSKVSYNFKSLKPVILTPKQAFTELFEGKAGFEIFWQHIFKCTSLQKQNNFHFLQNNPYVHFCVYAI